MLSPQRSRGFYDPLSEMNRLFDQVFSGLARRSRTEPQGDGGRETTAAVWAPDIDVLHRDDDLVIRAELPGATPDEVDITIQNNVLTISGRVSEEREEERGGYLVRERRAGAFRRSLQLPQGIDENRVNARFDNGVLEVVLEGAAASQEPTRVEVQGQQNDGGSNGGRSREQEGAQQSSGGRGSGSG